MSECNITQMIGEMSRYIFHIVFLNLVSITIRGNSIYDDFPLILISTIISIICYHLFARKIVEPGIKKMKIICKKRYDDKMNKVKKRKYIYSP